MEYLLECTWDVGARSIVIGVSLETFFKELDLISKDFHSFSQFLDFFSIFKHESIRVNLTLYR